MPDLQTDGTPGVVVRRAGRESISDGAPAPGDRARALLDAVDDTAIFEISLDGHVCLWTEAARRTLLYTEQEALGSHLSRFHSVESAATGEPARWIEAARQSGRAEDRGWRVRRDGSVFYASAVLVALPDADGAPSGFAVVYRDITIQYAAEEHARQTEARQLQLLAQLDDTAVCELSAQGEIRNWSPGAERLFGYTAAEMVGQPLSSLYPGNDAAADGEQTGLQAVRATGSWCGEQRLQRQDGTVVRCRIQQVLQRDSAESLSGILWTARDITDTARLDELERAGHRVQAFLAILAHELRNPLAPIRNAVDVIRLTPGGDTRIRHCAEIIGRQLQLLTRLVNDLMDVGRVTSGKLKVQRVPILYNDVVTASIEAIRPALDAASQTLTVTLPPGPVFVNGDAARLEQVMSNLLSNATKYTPRGGTVTVRVRADDGQVITTISDTGRGIADAALERIFHLFAQEGDADTARSGLGIGLALARAVVDAHGGAIRASSAGEGRGSTFTVILPEVEMDGAGMQRASPATCTGQRILIVDDSADSADSMAELLIVLGHDARPAYTGLRALEMLRDFTPDVVLLDLEMPDMSGFEVLAVLRREHPGLRVFALTGRGTPEDRRLTESAGFDAHLVKPLTVEALCRALAGDLRA
ncbi:PAS domain-containing hybrid sensor histidine kinase/response regulator [Cupriavidus pauculus]|uniref:PAS domain-containing hybrid sensor histidine kinase/response regulator n=1 Tax=Cupriavidus pauculus TaxID=82633 RepID=UPI0012489B17|nr:ATP-binding protein [Cupriavidus pauculus]KAB0601292.1 PAS domain S-box protein [Cupriavidus pauculus]UAL03038.1 PAS domain S-box protein [Cupriavidus pauculus]